MVSLCHFLRFAVLLVVASASAASNVFLETFDTYSHAKNSFGDTTKYKLRADTFGLAGVVTSTDSSRSTTLDIDLDPDSLRGAKVVVSGWCRASGLTQRPDPWNGVKVMLVTEDSLGAKSYPQLEWADHVSGWGWQRQWLIASLPQNLKAATLVVGLELMAGRVAFDSLRVTRVAQGIAPARDPKIPIPDFAPTRLRGAMIGTSTVDSAAIDKFGRVWKGNLLRWQLNAPWPNDSGLIDSKYEQHLATELAKLDRALVLCQKFGIKVVVDLHGMSQHLFHDAAAQSRLIDTWSRLASRYRTSPAVWGWDLANEPNEAEWSEGLLFWDELADTLARVIRKIDTTKVIIVEPASGGGISEMPNLKPVGWNRGYDIPKVVYSFHYYLPGNLTGQGELEGAAVGVVYPGKIDGVVWDSAQMRKSLQPAYDFQRKYRMPLYVGEFSCIRWAPQHSALHWLTDLTRLFESAGWDWSYHAYQEYQGWSVEYSDSATDLHTPVETDRKRLLLSHFANNHNPYATTSVEPTPSAEPAAPLGWRRCGNREFSVDHLVGASEVRLVRVDGSKSINGEAVADGWHFSKVAPGMWILRIHGEGVDRSLRLMLP